jgi:cobalt/nickel transport system permease protein
MHRVSISTEGAVTSLLRTDRIMLNCEIIATEGRDGFMHAPDGFLNAGTALVTAGLSVAAVGIGLRQSRQQLADRQIPLAGLAAAFVFAAQMFNFPVASGTTGHLLGGVLVAILLGPATGCLVVTVVIVIQALIFADGGLSALGYNVLNMAVITSFGGYALYRGLRRLLPPNASGVVVAGGLAAAGSVVLAAMAFSIEWLFGATAPVPFDTVFGAMVGVHLLIGIGEGIITAMTLAAVLAARSDLVAGASDLDPRGLGVKPVMTARGFLLAGALTVVVAATVVSQFAAPSPDGLERVARDNGIAPAAEDQPVADTVFADYATRGLSNENVSLAVAGATGATIAAAVGWGLATAIRTRRPTASAVLRT